MKQESQRIRRGLVVEGGGGKGAFALGCMKAFRERGITFDAVAGTSAGALCALIWATNFVTEGEQVWMNIGHSTFFGAPPDGCLRRITKVLLICGKLFAAFIRLVDPEGRLHFGRDVFFSFAVGIFYWLLLLGLVPAPWLWIAFPVVVPSVAICCFANELPGIGWDSEVTRPDVMA